MVRETRHLWVGNLPDNIREDRIRDHFKRYGRVQNVKLLGRTESTSTITAPSVGSTGVCATVAFMDIKSASKAHNAEHVLDERTLTTEYYEPAAIPSSAGAPSAGSSPAGSGYSGSSSSVNSAPAPASVSRYHLSGGEESTGNACPLAATAAAPANWRGTNDSATDYCRRGNTPAGFGRYQRNNSSNAPYATPPSNVDRTTTPHHRWYASSTAGGGGAGGATGGESTPSTPGGGTEGGGRRRRHSGSGSSRSESSSPEPSDTSRASTPAAPPPAQTPHANHRTPPAHQYQWAATANGRPLAICVRNLPTRSTDSSLKDGLYHEYKKHGKVMWVKVVGQNADRYAVVRFKKPSDVEKALEVSQDKLFFGCKISVAPHQSCDEDADSAKPYETDIDEYHPKATRTLFIGNLEKDVTQQQLRDKFKHFGRIIEIDIKKGSGGGAGYAFCQYASISSVVEAIRAMDGEYVGASRIKLGFGKPVATTCVWVDGLTEHTEKQVLGAVSRCGAATSVCVDRAAGAALVHFEQAAAAGAAVRELRRVAAQAALTAEPDHPRLCVDYASRECQEAFYEQLEKHGGSTVPPGERIGNDITGRYLPTTRHDPLRYDGCGSRSRASSYGRGSSRTPRYPALEHYDSAEYPADRRYRVYDELGSSPQTEDPPYEDRLQSVVVSPHRARRHRRDSSPEDRKHSKERHRSAGGSIVTVACGRRSRSGSRTGERHAGRRRHRRRRDVSIERGSRAGTPLRDEPDAAPSEPRRQPRERPPLPMSLPLPKFAAQLLRAAAPAPRAVPAPAPAPDSPPRPPSASSSSAGSAPHSPSLEERIRSLDEKYERWSGSRALADAPERARLRHRLLEVDINEVKPSEVVRSLLAKRSVFDEDSERLEGAARAPSPGGSPRCAAPRALRYPFPAHAPPPPPAPARPALLPEAEPDAAERPCDPRLNRAERPLQLERPHQLERLTKFNDTEFRIEPRIRPRTPSSDRSQPDICERRSPRVEGELDGDSRGILERRRRDSLLFSGSKSSTDTGNEKDSGDISDRTDSDFRSNETPVREKSISKDNFAPLDRRQIERTKDHSCDSLLNDLFDRKSEKDLDSSVVDQCEENIARDIADILLKQEKEDVQTDLLKIDSPKEVISKSNEEHSIQPDSDSSVHKEARSCEDDGNKGENSNENIKMENEICKDILAQNHIKDFLDLDSEPPQIELSASDLEKITKEVSHMVSQQEYIKVGDKNGKERFNLGTLHNTKLEKENIEFEKVYESEKYSSNTHFFSEKKVTDAEKHTEERIRSDREKSKHSRDRSDKDKHEHDKDKSKSNKVEKLERSEKDKKSKDTVHTEKSHGDKGKSEIERVHKDRHERDNERSKHADDKSSRHDHHRKDKLDKDKRKDSTDSDIKVKKEDKHKHDKSKKESQDSKRDCKKDSDLVKSRKSSRDENPRDLCRKDSTDSSTSRASHESVKVKEESNEIKEIKEEPKLNIRHYNDLFCKQEGKDLLLTPADLDSLIKSEAKEEPDHQPAVKNKNDSNLEVSVKPKVEVTEKQRHYSVDSPTVDSKRKERLNSCSSLPPNIGYKRRMSSQDSLDCLYEDIKKSKNETKGIERRDSKDSKNSDSKHKTTKFNKGHFAKLIESKTKDDKKNQVKPPDDVYDVRVKEESKDQKLCSERMKSSKKSPKSNHDDKLSTESSSEGLQNDLDFLATLELRSSEEDEKQRALRKEMKEKKRIQQLQQIQALQLQQDALHQAELMNKLKDDKKQKCDDKRKEAAREKRMSTDRKSREDKNDVNKRKNRKQLSTDSSDSDEPKKHSIFDIVDDGPTYISMYDKVKARSCKNMQKQEEEKRQEKIKAKFSQLKQSRAKREEKKRSSWDEDSDSEQDRKKTHKSSVDSSTDDDHLVIHNKKREKLHRSSIDFDHAKSNDYFNTTSNEEDSRNKLSRKNSRSRIMSDTSDDETVNKRSSSRSPTYITHIKKEVISDSESSQRVKDDVIHLKELSDDKMKRNSLLNLFGKSDSDDSKLKSSLEIDLEYKHNFNKSISHDFSSESECMNSNRNTLEIRKKHKRKQKKHKSSFSDDEGKVAEINEGEAKHKNSEKLRRHSNKKDKRKDKIRESVDTDDTRDDKIRIKKDKKLTNSSFDFSLESMAKKEGKMEDIFGPLSDESDKEARIPLPNNKLDYSHNYDSYCTPNDQQPLSTNCDESKFKERDENKRKKEKRRRDKRYIAKEDENSLDVDAVSKAIEARLIEDTITDDENRSILDSLDIKRNDINDFKYKNDLPEINKINDRHIEKLKKDCREKKKKKKRSREQRRKEHHHHYHHHHDKLDKVDIISDKPLIEISNKTLLLDIPLPNEAQPENITDKSDDCKSLSESPSLPRLTESPPVAALVDKDADSQDADPRSPGVISIESSIDSEYLGKKMIEVDEIPMPAPIECDISEVPLPSDPLPVTSEISKKETPFASTLVDDIDNSETAVRSISNLSDVSPTVDKVEAPVKADKKVEEKPRAIISQEETEDAVAALLGESFGGKVDSFSDYEQVENNVSHQTEIENVAIENENIPEEDAEEMRQAVQNLNASEMEMKPDTPVSDSDLLLIDTDTEEADETPQDAIERLPINIIATNQSLNTTAEQSKTSEASSIVIAKPKTTIVKVLSSEDKDPNVKVSEPEFKFQLAKRETQQQITSTATPVITSWTLSGNKLNDPHVLHIQPNQIIARDKSEVKPTHITANIVQIKSSSNQNVQINSSTLRPIITPARVSAPYQVINQMIRPQVSNIQPPTIKIPEQHILYQKSPGIVISPRTTNDPRLQSPKTTTQSEGLLSPRLTNMAILSTSQNMNSVGIGSQNMQQRSPGQVTVVRMQQPPLSPIQAMHLPHGARTMVSPSRPNSVLVQTQGAPIHFNRLPVTPVLAPISKQISVSNIVQQNKGINVSSSPTIHQPKIIATTEVRKTELRNTPEGVNEPSKIILSPTSIQQSSNPTVMAQNRLISMQNAMHVGNINTSLHLPNKVLINNINSINDKRENLTPKSEQHNHKPFGSSPIIHVAGVNHTTASIIQSGSKPVMCTIQEPNNITRNQNSNVIHTMNSPRLLTTAPITKVIQIDAANKVGPPSVLSMAAIRSPTVLTRLESSNSVAVTTTSLTNVVMTPLLLKTTNAPGAIRLTPKSESDHSDSHLHNHISRESDKKGEEKSNQPKLNTFMYDSIEKHKEAVYMKNMKPVSSVESITKCETDFEELLKDNTNEIKVTNDPEKKLEVNVGKNVTLITTNLSNRERKKSFDEPKKEIIESKTSTEDTKIELNVSDSKEDKKMSDSDASLAESRKSDIKTTDSSSDFISTPPKTESSAKSSSETSISNKISQEDKVADIKNTAESDETNIFILLSKETENQENHMKNLDENDSWSAKDVNIDSVIKKVDSLCNENLDDHEVKNDSVDSGVKDSVEMAQINSSSEKMSTESDSSKSFEMSLDNFHETSNDDLNIGKNTTVGKRGGRNVRGKKSDKNQDRVQTRQISKPPRGASAKRGRGRAKVDKKVKSFVNNISNNMPGDVYDFHEDSGDESATSPAKSEARPRLILTIKSPQSGLTNVTSSLSIKDQPKTTEKICKEDKPEDFVSPSPNTRKSRRLQEKDVQRSTVDDVIDDVVKGTNKNRKRPTRQAGLKVNQTQEKASATDTRKSPRGAKRVRDRSLSDASMDSGDEKLLKKDEAKEPKVPRLAEAVLPTKVEPEPPIVSAPVPSPTQIPAPAIKPAAPVVPVQPPNPTPIMKPPKKMISEISAKLASAFEAAAAAGPPRAQAVPAGPQHAAERAAPELDKPVALPLREPRAVEPAAADQVPLRAEPQDVSFARRLVDGVPGALMPVGTDADARVQSPALPHRPPSTHRPADRATPVLMRGGDGDGAMGPVGVVGMGGLGLGAELGPASAAGGAGAGAGASRGFRGAYAGPASLPRGAHHPPPHQPLQPLQPLQPHAKQVAVVSPHHPHPGNVSRVTLTSVPNISPQGQMAMSADLVRSPPPAHQQTSPVTTVYHNGDGMYPHFSHQHYQMYQQHFRATQHESRTTPSPYTRSLEAEGCEAPTPPLELRRPPSARVPRPAHSPAPPPADRLIMYAVGAGAGVAPRSRSPPPAHGSMRPPAPPGGVLSGLPPAPPGPQGPPHASQVPREADSLQMLLRRYPVMWQGLLALKNDSAAVQMHFVGGNPGVAGDTLPRLADGSTPLLRIAQRMRLEPTQLDQVHRKMKMENEHCMLLALPCGRDHMDVLQQSTNLTAGFITYLQRKQAAGIVNVAPPGHHQAMFTVHIFPSCDFANENLNRIAPDLMHRVADIAHLLIVIATV